MLRQQTCEPCQRHGTYSIARTHHFPLRVCRTLRISCEAVPPSVSPAGAQGGTSACSTGAALSFVSCIRLLGSPVLHSSAAVLATPPSPRHVDYCAAYQVPPDRTAKTEKHKRRHVQSAPL